MNLSDAELLGKQMLDAVKGYVARSLAPLARRMEEMETRVAGIPAGPKGENGERGEKGEKGDTGEQGEKGDMGLSGPPARDGEPGERGERGEKGEPGEVGQTGEKGERGADGTRGEQGEPGVQGVAGLAGRDGKDGKDGESGRDGLNGKSAYEIAVEKGFSGSELQWLDALHGKEGLPGAAGRDGKDGRDGREGKDGGNGRDAAQLDPLPGIDLSRSYARGTWASHAGGLLRASRKTDPILGMDAPPGEHFINAGWVVMVEGVSGIAVTQGEDPRNFSVVTILTSGAHKQNSFHIPAVIECGVWREVEYQKGDGVTWDGSYWIAQNKTSAKPGSSSDWRLAVKRGRDGKDHPGTPEKAARETVRIR